MEKFLRSVDIQNKCKHRRTVSKISEHCRSGIEECLNPRIVKGIRRHSECRLVHALILALLLGSPYGLRAYTNQVIAWGAGTFVSDPPDFNNYGQSIVPTNLTSA